MGDSNTFVKGSARSEITLLETVQKQSLGLLTSLPGGWSSERGQFRDEQGCFKERCEYSQKLQTGL